MNSIVQEILLWIINKILTQDVIKGSEKDLIDFLRGLAAKSPDAVILNGMIDVLATALGV